MDLNPYNVKSKSVKKRINAFIRNIVCTNDKSEEALEKIRVMHIGRLLPLSPREKLIAEAAINVFADLAKMEWTFELTRGGNITGNAPKISGAGDIRVVRRRQLSAKRNEQLRKPSNRDFVARMESGHVFNGQMISIFNLMRDGREIADWLIKNRKEPQDFPILPYIQFVNADSLCRHTGFRLQDIWRYFRHTWTSSYESVPGRSLLLLVRDAGAAFHPVIGIAALASAASVLPARDDQFIGWSGDAFTQFCIENPSNRIAQWAKETVQNAIKEIYRTDFVAQGIIPLRIRAKEIPVIVARLRRVAASAKEKHILQGEAHEHKIGEAKKGQVDRKWEVQSRTDLFRSKRATELASLIQIQGVIDTAYRSRRGKDRIKALCESAEGRDAFKKIVRIARSRAIGTAIADLVVCGAIPPYNEILGGKLVAMLAASPEVVLHYKRRYAGVPSVIASSMAGRSIVRRANLVYIGTTSLYGIRPSQYDRIRIPMDRIGGKAAHIISYRYLGDTGGVGTAQFGYATKKSLEKLLLISNSGFRKVNNVFGEGANPNLRALRDGLVYLGFSEALMIHGLKKSVYGVPLIDDLREYLLGICKRPKYYFPLQSTGRTNDGIAKWWYERWVVARCERADIVEKLSRHSLIRPITHGARVLLPDVNAV